MIDWRAGLTSDELDEAQERYEVRFPPDMVAFYAERWPTKAYDWSVDNPLIRKKLQWPLKMLLQDVESGCWWTDWGERPTAKEQREALVAEAVIKAPRLLPIYSHRFIPEEPHEPGNPVFSMHGFDTIYYGANLGEYFHNEFDGEDCLVGVPREKMEASDVARLRLTPFWSELAFGSEKLLYDEALSSD